MRITVLTMFAMLLGCGSPGSVNQGRVVEFAKDQGLVTLVSDSNYRDPSHPRFDVMPPVTIHTPDDPREMGPEPRAGQLLLLDCAQNRAVIFDRATRSLKPIRCRLLSESPGVLATDARVAGRKFPVIDPRKNSVTVYSARERKLIEFSVPPEFCDWPSDTWRFGDEIRYYYKDPGQALRLMNVTRTDLNKAAK